MKYFSCFYHTILFRCSKNIRLNSTHNIAVNPPNEREPSSHSKFYLIIHPILTFKVTMYYKTIFLVIDTTLASDNSSRFKKNLLERI